MWGENYSSSKEPHPLQTLVRNLLAISAGSLVATVSIVEIFVHDDSRWLALLPVTWLLLAVCILASIVFMANDIGYAAIVEGLKLFSADAEELTGGMSSEIGIADRVAAAIKVRTGQLEEKERSWKIAKGAVLAALVAFALGLVTLTTFAIRNLPW